MLHLAFEYDWCADSAAYAFCSACIIQDALDGGTACCVSLVSLSELRLAVCECFCYRRQLPWFDLSNYQYTFLIPELVLRTKYTSAYVNRDSLMGKGRHVQ